MFFVMFEHIRLWGLEELLLDFSMGVFLGALSAARVHDSFEHAQMASTTPPPDRIVLTENLTFCAY